MRLAAVTHGYITASAPSGGVTEPEALLQRDARSSDGCAAQKPPGEQLGEAGRRRSHRRSRTEPAAAPSPPRQPQGPPPSAAASRQRPPPAARDPRRGAGRAGRRPREGERARDARPRARDADAAPPLPPRRAVAEGRPLPRSAAPGGAELGAERPGPAGPDGGGRAGAAPRGAG